MLGKKFVPYVSVFAIILFTLLLFLPAFSSYFFQDDWFSFLISRATSLQDFLGFFVPRTDVIYYRPLGMQVPFFLNYTFFGLNPFPFRIATFLIHLVNGFLFYNLLEVFLKNKRLSVFGSLLYLFLAAHFIVFYWSATFAFVLAPLIYFGSFLFFVRNRKKLSLFVFIIGFFVNELCITVPIIMSAWIIYQKQSLKKVIIFWIPSFLYAFFRLTVARFPTSGGYTFLTSVHQLFVNLRNYLLWCLNWPDEMYNQFNSLFMINPLFIKTFLTTVVLLGFLSLLILLLLYVAPLVLLMKKGIRYIPIFFVFGIIWFLVSLSPVLFFSKHYFSYYAPIAFFGFMLSGLSLVKAAVPKFIRSNLFIISSFLLLMLWYGGSWHTIRLNKNIHWAPQRAVQSKILVTQALKKYSSLPKNTTIIVADGGKTDELKWSLGEQNAMKVIYNDVTIETFFGSEMDYHKLFGSLNKIYSIP